MTYPNDAIREVLHKTLGVPLFQEQAMRLAVVAAGFTPGEADALRRAMGAWRRPGIIEQFHERLIEGMVARGLAAEFAERVFLQIRGFGEYGFPESHAASFALLVYVSAWLKHYYPAAFAAALINSQPMGFYAPAQLVRNAREHGVPILPIDVNYSRWECTLERAGSPDQEALRLGLRLASGLSANHAEMLEQARGDGPFTSLADVARRAKLTRAVLARLAWADAFSSMGLDRRQALWQALGQDASSAVTESRPLFAALTAEDEPFAPLPVMPEEQKVLADYNTLGLTLRAHPLSFHRADLDAMGIAPASRLSQLRHGGLVRVAGLVLVRQRPGTARGITFVTLEDETGTINLIIHQQIWQRFYRAARTATALLACGRLQVQAEVIHVLVSRLEDLSDRLVGLKSRSRDFQ